ncbi:MAG TPA: phage Gp37/Gp68 family protein [Steroidobacteraceae bacterium]|nr:phage Gp37/Gp68 family protein [Steroidobacteraceae bacterium]HRX87836.1 phage Gp37/Gp68 family protein [Steroidobacteraceae bacterium]
MASQTAIEWTDTTWNPVTGCTKVGRGCDNCYAERIAERFRGTPNHPFTNGFELALRPHKLTEPLSWRRPRRVFVNSMSDLFHKEIPRAFLDQVFDTMEQARWHQFQVLTKRSSLLRRYVNGRYAGGHSPEHIWLGVSIEDRSTLGRLKHLQQTRAAVRFVSFEPLLEDLGDVDLSGIHWAIAGGESGAKGREIKAEWIRSLRDQCRSAGVAFFFKQWGGKTPKSGGNTLDGRRWLQYPKSLRPAA